MSVAKMSHLKLLGLKNEKSKIMNILIRSHLFEVMPSSDENFCVRDKDTTHLDKTIANQAKLSFAIAYLNTLNAELANILDDNKKMVKRNPGAKPIVIDYVPKKTSASRQIIGYDDFYDVSAKEYELLNVCDALEKINFARLEARSEIAKLESFGKSLLPYEHFPNKFSILADTKNSFVSLLYNASTNAALPEKLKTYDVFIETYETQRGVLISLVGLKSIKAEVLALLNQEGFTSCSFSYDSTARELMADNASKIDALRSKLFGLLSDGLDYEQYLTDIKTLYDVLGQDIEKTIAAQNFINTNETFVIEGWLPSLSAENIIQKVKNETGNIITYLLDPLPDETPPTLIKSSKIIAPYEDVTNMYSVPSYNELDPNPFMAVFFFLFFGIMIGDAGYGFILSVGALIVLRFMKFEKGTKRLIALIGMGGISAIFWGVLFGGVFSIEQVPPLWFSPMAEPVKMLALSIIIGVIQVLFGYALLAVKHFRNHKPLDAILDVIFIYILIAGIACFALNMVLPASSGMLSKVGVALLVASLVGIVATAGRHKKGILQKLMGGFAGLYGLVNLLSDVLSYARLFGLGLASGAIGYAFNILGGMFFTIPIIGYPLGILILIPLHAFNLGIGVLGAYVHNARLQFLEFYGKFYDGGGMLFSPMGENTRYVRFS